MDTHLKDYLLNVGVLSGACQYTSTTAKSNGDDLNVKKYGDHAIEIDTKKLQQDIDLGRVENVEIIPPKQVQAELQKKVDKARLRFDSHPSPNNADRLERATNDLNNATRDNECLIKGCVPKNYIRELY